MKICHWSGSYAFIFIVFLLNYFTIYLNLTDFLEFIDWFSVLLCITFHIFFLNFLLKYSTNKKNSQVSLQSAMILIQPWNCWFFGFLRIDFLGTVIWYKTLLKISNFGNHRIETPFIVTTFAALAAVNCDGGGGGGSGSGS